MFRNQYDSDISTWSPQGRIFQIEYAMEAVKQGSAAVGLKSDDYAIVATLKRSNSVLAAHQKKIFQIDDHVGIAMAGLTADARVLSKFMRTECLYHKYIFDSELRAERLVALVADKAQVHTQRYGKRPYGVGLLVVAYDQTGSHLYEFSPDAEYYDYKAMAIGARAQSAKTYLEKTFETFPNATKDEMINHALFALRESLGAQSDGLTSKNTAIGIVGVDQPFTIIEDDDIIPYLNRIDEEDDDDNNSNNEEEDDESMGIAG
eukprot:TRINITY_DN208_c1_g2_i1.p1 TRINITY_DN208_c1_g2~~TRINITY_DN208_c1_g2_i1.p1  ORF type:complete len:262 (+),score=122.29 TRINITY_DN208_c1_g2_i1:113-898(+)